LIVAEIELSSETETLKDLFGWVKVTHLNRYYNAYLSKHPYKNGDLII
jgi:CYTH domain-containing protein